MVAILDIAGLEQEHIIKLRRKRAKTGQIVVYYGKAEKWDVNPDLCVVHGEGTRKPDARLVMDTLGPLADELVRRGYDIDTLSFSISKSVPEVATNDLAIIL